MSSIAGRARTLRQDVQRKISRLRQQRQQQQQQRPAAGCAYLNNSVSSDQTSFPCSASSVESLPSGSGSLGSTQALVRAGSNHSSIVSCCGPDEQPQLPFPASVICRARAVVDCVPSPYDKDALAFKVRTARQDSSRALLTSFRSLFAER